MTDRLDRDRLETLFQAGVLSRRQFVQGLLALGMSAASVEGVVGTLGHVDADSQTAPSAQYLALIVLDGFRPDYLHYAPMPAFHALANEGTMYTRAWVGHLESETPTGHATITTGAFPKHHGVIGFEWRDPVSRREVLDGWEQGQDLGQVGRDIHAHHAASIPEAIKKADPKALVVTLSSEKVYAADAMGAKSADYVLYHTFSHHHLLPAGLPGQVPPGEFFRAPHLKLALPLKRFSDWDYLSSELALTAFAQYRPKALMVNLPGSDVYGHKFGGPGSPQIMGKVITGQDHAIHRLVQAYKKAGIYDRTLFVITADHGMVPNSHEVSGAQVAAAAKRAGARYLFHTGGTAKYIYLQDSSRSRAKQMAIEMTTVPAVIAGYYRLPNGEYRRAAGVIPPELDAAFRALMTTFTGPIAPDVVAPYRENTVGTALKQLYGNHGGLSWGVQQIPLVLAGPGVRRGYRSQLPARLVDVAPTILRLLGISSSGLDGTVLADALVHASATDTAAQHNIATQLRPHQNALIAQSQSDLAEDRRDQVTGRPRVPAQP